MTSKPRPNSEPALSFSFLCQLGTIGEGRGPCCPSPARATARMKFIFLSEPSRYPWHTARRAARVPSPTPTAPESTCHLPRRGIGNQSSTRGERRPVPHPFVRVGSQITGCSNLYPLNASQSVLEVTQTHIHIHTHTNIFTPRRLPHGGGLEGGYGPMVSFSLKLAWLSSRAGAARSMW